MSHRDEPYFEPPNEPPERGPAPRRPAEEEWSERDERWSRDRREPARQKPKRSAIRRILIFVIGVIVLLGLLGGAGYLAISLGWIDASRLGLSGSGIPGRPQSPDAEIIFSGRAGDLSAAEGNIVQEDTSVSPPVIWLRSSLKQASPAGASDGVSLQIPSSLLPRIEGRNVQITVSARTGGRGVPSPFAVAYSAGDRGNSGWVVFTPTRAVDDYSFSYQVPIGEVSDPDNRHYIGIWSDISGGNAPLALDRISIQPR
ncbi:MAG: hypothetical protein GY798_17680 [Hyphomicrobiales bacterium]|nr:hypothetical protein [Hyphomicrobiales bacterium]